MTKQELLYLVSLGNVVLTTDNAVVEQVTIGEAVTRLISDVVADTVPYDVDGTVSYDAVVNAPSESTDETPFTISDTPTLASQPYYSYDLQC